MPWFPSACSRSIACCWMSLCFSVISWTKCNKRPTYFVVIWQTVCLVNEDFKCDFGIDLVLCELFQVQSEYLVGLGDCVVQFVEGFTVIVLQNEQILYQTCTCASMTKTSAPHPPKIASASKVPSKKSICPGKSQIWNCTKELLETSKQKVSGQILAPLRPLLTILLVLSRNKVSLGDILWKTTFWMLDFPLLVTRVWVSVPHYKLCSTSSTPIAIFVACALEQVGRGQSCSRPWEGSRTPCRWGRRTRIARRRSRCTRTSQWNEWREQHGLTDRVKLWLTKSNSVRRGLQGTLVKETR